MNSFTLLFVCAQAFFIQNAVGQCSVPAVPVPAVPVPAPVYAVPTPACNAAPAPYYPGPAPAIPVPGMPWGGVYGIKVSGDNLSIDGQAQVSGSIPFVSSVQLDGDVPAEGEASLRNACACGDAYLR